MELSGGQWQKVALARAFMREEADILILDEPTAALDAEAEHAVFERFRALAAGRTTILISHRFPTVRMADRILVLEAGRVVEDGTHAALVAAGASLRADVPAAGLRVSVGGRRLPSWAPSNNEGSKIDAPEHQRIGSP